MATSLKSSKRKSIALNLISRHWRALSSVCKHRISTLPDSSARYRVMMKITVKYSPIYSLSPFQGQSETSKLIIPTKNVPLWIIISIFIFDWPLHPMRPVDYAIYSKLFTDSGLRPVPKLPESVGRSSRELTYGRTRKIEGWMAPHS